jgi:hypothetical protein
MAIYGVDENVVVNAAQKHVLGRTARLQDGGEDHHQLENGI